jgi:hypothetical protein
MSRNPDNCNRLLKQGRIGRVCNAVRRQQRHIDVDNDGAIDDDIEQCNDAGKDDDAQRNSDERCDDDDDDGGIKRELQFAVLVGRDLDLVVHQRCLVYHCFEMPLFLLLV